MTKIWLLINIENMRCFLNYLLIEIVSFQLTNGLTYPMMTHICCCAIWWCGITLPRSRPNYLEKTIDKITGRSPRLKKWLGRTLGIRKDQCAMWRLLLYQQKYDFAWHHQMGKWKRLPMTYWENETIKACDSRGKVSKDPSESRFKAWGMMAT